MALSPRPVGDTGDGRPEASPEGAGSRTSHEASAKAALLLRLRTKGVRDLAVLRAIETVPRHLFLPGALAALATRDLALPIACGQTASRPSLVARSLEALQCRAEDRVLEIGTGSGYATALLSILGAEVRSVERFRTLADAAAAVLGRLDLSNVTVEVADGLAAPASQERFTRIMLHASVAVPPATLMARLEPEGLLVCGLQASGHGGATRLARFRPGREDAPEMLGPCDLAPVATGLSAVL